MSPASGLTSSLSFAPRLNLSSSSAGSYFGRFDHGFSVLEDAWPSNQHKLFLVAGMQTNAYSGPEVPWNSVWTSQHITGPCEQPATNSAGSSGPDATTSTGGNGGNNNGPASLTRVSLSDPATAQPLSMQPASFDVAVQHYVLTLGATQASLAVSADFTPAGSITVQLLDAAGLAVLGSGAEVPLALLTGSSATALDVTQLPASTAGNFTLLLSHSGLGRLFLFALVRDATPLSSLRLRVRDDPSGSELLRPSFLPALRSYSAVIPAAAPWLSLRGDFACGSTAGASVTWRDAGGDWILAAGLDTHVSFGLDRSSDVLLVTSPDAGVYEIHCARDSPHELRSLVVAEVGQLATTPRDLNPSFQTATRVYDLTVASSTAVIEILAQAWPREDGSIDSLTASFDGSTESQTVPSDGPLRMLLPSSSSFTLQVSSLHSGSYAVHMSRAVVPVHTTPVYDTSNIMLLRPSSPGDDQSQPLVALTGWDFSTSRQLYSASVPYHTTSVSVRVTVNSCRVPVGYPSNVSYSSTQVSVSADAVEMLPQELLSGVASSLTALPLGVTILRIANPIDTAGQYVIQLTREPPAEWPMDTCANWAAQLQGACPGLSFANATFPSSCSASCALGDAGFLRFYQQCVPDAAMSILQPDGAAVMGARKLYDQCQPFRPISDLFSGPACPEKQSAVMAVCDVPWLTNSSISLLQLPSIWPCSAACQAAWSPFVAGCLATLPTEHIDAPLVSGVSDQCLRQHPGVLTGVAVQLSAIARDPSLGIGSVQLSFDNYAFVQQLLPVDVWLVEADSSNNGAFDPSSTTVACNLTGMHAWNVPQQLSCVSEGWQALQPLWFRLRAYSSVWMAYSAWSAPVLALAGGFAPAAPKPVCGVAGFDSVSVQWLAADYSQFRAPNAVRAIEVRVYEDSTDDSTYLAHESVQQQRVETLLPDLASALSVTPQDRFLRRTSVSVDASAVVGSPLIAPVSGLRSGRTYVVLTQATLEGFVNGTVSQPVRCSTLAPSAAAAALIDTAVGGSPNSFAALPPRYVPGSLSLLPSSVSLAEIAAGLSAPPQVWASVQLYTSLLPLTSASLTIRFVPHKMPTPDYTSPEMMLPLMPSAAPEQGGLLGPGWLSSLRAEIAIDALLSAADATGGWASWMHSGSFVVAGLNVSDGVSSWGVRGSAQLAAAGLVDLPRIEHGYIDYSQHAPSTSLRRLRRLLADPSSCLANGMNVQLQCALTIGVPSSFPASCPSSDCALALEPYFPQCAFGATSDVQLALYLLKTKCVPKLPLVAFFPAANLTSCTNRQSQLASSCGLETASFDSIPVTCPAACAGETLLFAQQCVQPAQLPRSSSIPYSNFAKWRQLCSATLPAPPTTPGAPIVQWPARLQSTSSVGAHLSWANAASNMPILSYQLEQRVGVNGAWMPLASVDPMLTGNSFDATNLSFDIAYSFRISAINSGGASPFSSPSTPAAVSSPPPTPAAPTATLAPGCSDGGSCSILVVWPAVTLPYGSAYVLFTSTTAGTAGLYSGSSSQYIFTSPAPDTDYTFTVQVASGTGVRSPVSAPTAIRTPVAPVPPPRITLQWQNGTHVLLQLTPPVIVSGPSLPPTHVQLNLTRTDAGAAIGGGNSALMLWPVTWLTDSFGMLSGSVYLGVTPGAAYNLTAASASYVGTPATLVRGPWGTSLAFAAKTLPCGPVSGLRVVSISSVFMTGRVSASLIWQAPSDLGGASSISSYILLATSTLSPFALTSLRYPANVVTTGVNVSLPTFTQGAQVFFSVTPLTGAQTGPSTTISGMVPVAVPPPMPMGRLAVLGRSLVASAATNSTLVNHAPSLSLNSSQLLVPFRPVGSAQLFLSVADEDAAVRPSAQLLLTLSAVGSAALLVLQSLPLTAGSVDVQPSAINVPTATLQLRGTMAELNSVMLSGSVRVSLGTSEFDPTLFGSVASVTVLIDDLANGGDAAVPSSWVPLTAAASVALYADASTAPAPKLLSARLCDDALSVVVTFDVPVAGCGVSDDCCALFANSTRAAFGSSAVCKRVAASVVGVQLSSDNAAVPSQLRIVLANPFVRMMANSTASVSGSVILQPALSPLPPLVLRLQVPSSFSSCADLLVSADVSGVGALAWSVEWSVVADQVSRIAFLAGGAGNSSIVVRTDAMLGALQLSIGARVRNYAGTWSPWNVVGLAQQGADLPQARFLVPSESYPRAAAPTLVDLRVDIAGTRCISDTAAFRFRFEIDPPPANTSMLNLMLGSAQLPTAVLRASSPYTVYLAAAPLLGVAAASGNLSWFRVASKSVSFLPNDLLVRADSPLVRNVSADAAFQVQVSLANVDPGSAGLASFSWRCLTASGGPCRMRNNMDLTLPNQATVSVAAGALLVDTYLFDGSVFATVEGSMRVASLPQFTVRVLTAGAVASSQQLTECTSGTISNGAQLLLRLQNGSTQLGSSATLVAGGCGVTTATQPRAGSLTVSAAAAPANVTLSAVGWLAPSSVSMLQYQFFSRPSPASNDSLALQQRTTLSAMQQASTLVVSLPASLPLQRLRFIVRVIDMISGAWTELETAASVPLQPLPSSAAPATSPATSLMPLSGATSGVGSLTAMSVITRAMQVTAATTLVLNVTSFTTRPSSSRRLMQTASSAMNASSAAALLTEVRSSALSVVNWIERTAAQFTPVEALSVLEQMVAQPMLLASPEITLATLRTLRAMLLRAQMALRYDAFGDLQPLSAEALDLESLQHCARLLFAVAEGSPMGQLTEAELVQLSSASLASLPFDPWTTRQVSALLRPLLHLHAELTLSNLGAPQLLEGRTVSGRYAVGVLPLISDDAQLQAIASLNASIRVTPRPGAFASTSRQGNQPSPRLRFVLTTPNPFRFGSTAQANQTCMEGAAAVTLELTQGTPTQQVADGNTPAPLVYSQQLSYSVEIAYDSTSVCPPETCAPVCTLLDPASGSFVRLDVSTTLDAARGVATCSGSTLGTLMLVAAPPVQPFERGQVDSNSIGISVGLAVGLGVGLACLALLCALLWLAKRRQSQRRTNSAASSVGKEAALSGGLAAVAASPLSATTPATVAKAERPHAIDLQPLAGGVAQTSAAQAQAAVVGGASLPEADVADSAVGPSLHSRNSVSAVMLHLED